MPAIAVRDLSKTFRTFSRREGLSGSLKDLFSRSYRDLIAVDSISFTVDEGETLGYIGPNGAGKSTSIKMLTGILKPTSGDVSVLGFNPFLERKAYAKSIGVVFGQRTQLWWDIAVVESFRLLGSIYRVGPEVFRERLAKLDGILALKELLHTPVRKLSLGQRVRCDLAASLLHRPRILFLDEPTVGLDAVGKDSVRTFLREINREFGTTILLTTHDLKEIEELCQRIIVIDKGKLIFDGSLSAIKSLPGLERKVTVDFLRVPALSDLDAVWTGTVRMSMEGERRVVMSFDQQRVSSVEIVRSLFDRYEIADVTISEPDIEQVVMKIYREGVPRA